VTSAINRYYDPTTDQFLSIDPNVATTDQPYVFTNDNPLNATDPLGLKGWYCIDGVSQYFEGNKYGKVGTGKCASKPSPRPTRTPKPPAADGTNSQLANMYNDQASSPGQTQNTQATFYNPVTGSTYSCQMQANAVIKDGTVLGSAWAAGGGGISAIGMLAGAGAVETGGLSIAVAGGVLIFIALTGGLAREATC